MIYEPVMQDDINIYGVKYALLLTNRTIGPFKVKVVVTGGHYAMVQTKVLTTYT